MRYGENDHLDSWLEFLEIDDCPCEYEWESLRRLYGVDCGKGWVRITTEPDCPEHGRTDSQPHAEVASSEVGR